MASGPITSQQIDGEKLETETDSISLGSKITTDSDCSREIKKHLIFARKGYDKPRRILKSRDATLLTKIHIFKAMVFPVVMYGYETWTIKKNEHQRIDAFELWSWRRLLRVPWTARRSNQSILKETNPEYSLETLMLKLKLQYFSHPMWKADSLEKHPDAGKEWGQEKKETTEDEMAGWPSPTQRTWAWANSGRWWKTGKSGVLQSMGSQRGTRLSNWVTIKLFTQLTHSLPQKPQ